MTRLKLSLPEHSIFKTDLTIRITDINYGGHLANQAVLGLCHEIRIRFLRQYNFSELNFLGKGLIMSDAAVVYKNEAFAGEQLQSTLYYDDINPNGFDFYYCLKNGDNEIARAKTGMVFFDYDKRKISRAPQDLLSFFDSCK